MRNRCRRWDTIWPVQGWKCGSPADHDGPCPLWPTWWNLKAVIRYRCVPRRIKGI